MQPLTLALDPCMAAEKWLFPILSLAFVSLILFLSAISGFTASSSLLPAAADLRRGPNNPASFAFYLSGSRGDAHRLLRLLLAVYHPRNRYLLHLSWDAPASERAYLSSAARAAIPAIRAFGNVDVLGRGDAMTYMGSSVLAATLHAASVMLRLDGEWDWFVTLNAADYPLVTPDDLIHVFSSVPRDLNFIDHTSDLGWKESHRVQPIVVDPGIYLARRTQIFHATVKRKTPDAFKFFTGSPWVILSRSFLEYCIVGWDNLPRTLLMYFTNVPLPQEGYFHSVLCNAPEFQNKTVNNDLRYMAWDNPPQMEPHLLNVTDFDEMSKSGVPFARQFKKDDPVLDMIDETILDRSYYRPVPGAWCSGKRRWWTDPCSQWKDVNIVKPSRWVENFGKVMKKLVDDWNSDLDSCK
ncbi:beta-glucuronosyltransferase GlcAT14B [Dioscorea cayenensis subsp. rotundata]|uniref:Beta-glucuronosyltransferase GlcAT14B n=1 Tax=Dioscorea cayennensis subsp. rotundata TaxID=55577 RepID=A0AB40D076_DIOCR|nr:beta-glucuronosyltransferase GlcAT14B [Dioscorea cayenensis subsp. rotundata]